MHNTKLSCASPFSLNKSQYFIRVQRNKTSHFLTHYRSLKIGPYITSIASKPKVLRNDIVSELLVLLVLLNELHKGQSFIYKNDKK